MKPGSTSLLLFLHAAVLQGQWRELSVTNSAWGPHTDCNKKQPLTTEPVQSEGLISPCSTAQSREHPSTGDCETSSKLYDKDLTLLSKALLTQECLHTARHTYTYSRYSKLCLKCSQAAFQSSSAKSESYSRAMQTIKQQHRCSVQFEICYAATKRSISSIIYLIATALYSIPTNRARFAHEEKSLKKIYPKIHQYE